jgi:hypothetical protein
MTAEYITTKAVYELYGILKTHSNTLKAKDQSEIHLYAILKDR